MDPSPELFRASRHPEHMSSRLISVGSASSVPVSSGSVMGGPGNSCPIQLALAGVARCSPLTGENTPKMLGPACQLRGLMPFREAALKGMAAYKSPPLPPSTGEAGTGKYLLSQLPFHSGVAMRPSPAVSR